MSTAGVRTRTKDDRIRALERENDRLAAENALLSRQGYRQAAELLRIGRSLAWERQCLQTAREDLHRHRRLLGVEKPPLAILADPAAEEGRA